MVRLSFAPVVRQVAPAVVSITSRKAVLTRADPFAADPFFQLLLPRLRQAPSRRIETSLGSGVIVRADGLDRHQPPCGRGRRRDQVVLSDRREFRGQVPARDERTDLAVLKIDAGDHLPMLRSATPTRSQVGDLVLAIGDPFGIGQTVTSGIISALAGPQLGIIDSTSFIQTDAAINPGQFGRRPGQLDGDLVGINTSIFSRWRRLDRHRLRHPGQSGAGALVGAGRGRRPGCAALAGRRAASRSTPTSPSSASTGRGACCCDRIVTPNGPGGARRPRQGT